MCRGQLASPYIIRSTYLVRRQLFTASGPGGNARNETAKTNYNATTNVNPHSINTATYKKKGPRKDMQAWRTKAGHLQQQDGTWVATTTNRSTERPPCRHDSKTAVINRFVCGSAWFAGLLEPRHVSRVGCSSLENITAGSQLFDRSVSSRITLFTDIAVSVLMTPLQRTPFSGTYKHNNNYGIKK